MIKTPKKTGYPGFLICFLTVFDFFIMSTFSESGFLVEVSSGHVRTVTSRGDHLDGRSYPNNTPNSEFR